MPAVKRQRAPIEIEDLVPALSEIAADGSVVDPLIIDTLVARQLTHASSPLSDQDRAD